MKQHPRTRIDDLSALGADIPHDHLRWVSGGAGTKHIVMEPQFVYPMPSTCTGERVLDYD